MAQLSLVNTACKRLLRRRNLCGSETFKTAKLGHQEAIVFFAALLLIFSTTFTRAVTLEELRSDPDLTPQRFMEYFHDFRFKLGEKLQPPEVFLATQAGDCDDFASLAADIFREKHFTTRLIAIFMDGQTHVICYVEELKCYLDYNFRRESSKLQLTDGRLEDMATQVSTYFRARWRYVSEFTYQSGVRRFGRIVFH